MRPAGMRMRLGRLKQNANAVLTALGLRRKGFYSPYDGIARANWTVEPYPEVASLLARQRPVFEDFLARMKRQEARLLASQDDPEGPDWTSRWLSPLDCAVVYTGIAEFRPASVIEIGAGNTTHHMCRAVADHALPTRITCIDPAPRVDLGGFGVTLLKRPLSVADVDLFRRLAPGDAILIDSSHLLQQGFDVDILFNRGFPVLKPGVLVHLHDVFLPYGYPPDWETLRYNEQNALIGWLLSGSFEVLFAAHYVWRDMQDALAECCPGLPLRSKANGGSFWVRKT